MATPNLFIAYVTDIDRSVALYTDLFDMQPIVRTPRYVPFDLRSGNVFALWTGQADKVATDPVRTSEVGLMSPRTDSIVDDTYRAWQTKGVNVVESPTTTCSAALS